MMKAMLMSPNEQYVPKDVSKKVRKAAEPFLAWLKEADSEEESEEEE
jgi:translation initiation factor 5